MTQRNMFMAGLKAFEVSRTVEISSTEYTSNKAMVLGTSAYNAFFTFSRAAGLPDAHSDDIGCSKNPCIRFIINPPDGKQQRFYVTPAKDVIA